VTLTFVISQTTQTIRNGFEDSMYKAKASGLRGQGLKVNASNYKNTRSRQK